MTQKLKNIHDCSHKIISCTQAQDLGLKLKSRGQTLVFTNGCFDILHAGHISCLQQARSMGDALAVGMNSDDSVRRLKGPARPMQSQGDRAIILAALACVDYVIIFDQDTPLELVNIIKPTVLVKGRDYENQLVVGRREVESWGGRVELIELVEGRSTSKIVEKK